MRAESQTPLAVCQLRLTLCELNLTQPQSTEAGDLMRTTVPTASLAIAVGTLLATTVVRADAQEHGGPRVRVDTLEGGRIVVSNPDLPLAGPEEAPTLVEVLRIGSLDDTCDAFGNVMALAVDEDGRIYVADSQAKDIRVFSPEGECARTFGRSGEGPGEFRLLAGIVWQPPGFLWTIDSVHERLTVFDSLGTVLATHPLRLGPAAAHPWPMWVDGGGSLHLWVPGFDSIVRYGTRTWTGAAGKLSGAGDDSDARDVHRTDGHGWYRAYRAPRDTVFAACRLDDESVREHLAGQYLRLRALRDDVRRGHPANRATRS